jgi:hypothetical protein
MWPPENRLQAFKALSYRDKWRVGSCLRRGEAPEDPRLAAAVVDLAEGYRRRSRLDSWFPLVVIVLPASLSIVAAIDGDPWTLAIFGLSALSGAATLLLDPGRRPKNVARSLEASKQMLPSEWRVGSQAETASDDGPVEAGWYVEPDNCVVERLWDGGEWTSWVRPRPLQGGSIEPDPAGWQPHPSKPGKEVLWSGSDWTDHERDSVEGS